MRCPAPDCPGERDGGQIACRTHWFRLPNDLRRRIWRLYRDARGSIVHLESVREAIRLLKEMT